MDTSGNQDLIKTINQKLILEIIRQYNVNSIKEIAALTKLSIPATKKNVDFLVNRGLLSKTGTMNTKMGRKPTRYELNSTHKRVVAIDLGEIRVSLALCTLNGRLSRIVYMDLYRNESGEAFKDRLCACVDGLLKSMGVLNTDIAAMVIANPGVVNAQTGTLQLPAEIAVWHNIPLRTVFEEKYGVPAIVLNDVNVSAMGEMKCGAGVGLKNCIFIRLDVGLGAGIVINGELYEGFHAASGEIGSIILKSESAEPVRLQYADKWLTTGALVQRIRCKVSGRSQSLVQAHIEEAGEACDLDFIAAHWDDDTCIAQEMEQFIHVFSIFISNIEAVLDIPIVIIGGEAIALGERFLSEMQSHIQRLCAFPPKLIYAKNGSTSALLGAAAIGIEYYFENLEL